VWIVPTSNPCGLRQQTRESEGVDLNRGFTDGRNELPERFTKRDSGEANAILEQQIRSARSQYATVWVVDIHEAWGWIRDRQGSIGSALHVDPADPVAWTMSERMVARVNSCLNLLGRFNFMVEPDLYEEGGTLGAHIQWLRNETGPMHGPNCLHYILIEITGQHNVQSREVRTRQLKHLIYSLMDSTVFVHSR
jgi:hypothetical protein